MIGLLVVMWNEEAVDCFKVLCLISLDGLTESTNILNQHVRSPCRVSKAELPEY